ncbi:probable pectinesterase/pectinesterase inhibitor 47 [Arachis stenosperma]|uniref:probable pectinesterase/pectinesterase inhibitor 47 n=1 Tax=Arachis stenosperma TaxID=217475 RepID=UPI0025ABF7E1|nr:probable pectinesterase/pectinesterase inhibitor 47 [Arachis stenosperma]XP_057737051.1 probable pectinesterase/pectinesterase inhibitor 47 [Arachis stenosperma]
MSFLSISLFLSIFFFLFFFTPSSSSSLSSFPSSSSSSIACKLTLYPKLCRTLLSTIRNSPSDPYGYGKFSIKQSLKQATKLEKVFNDFLNRHNRQSNNNSSSLNNAEVSAIVDCRDLNKLNVDYLSSISAELKNANNNDYYYSNGAAELVDKIESYLSAVATNHETCYDGLVATKGGIGNALAASLKGATELYSVSLGLVSVALDKNMKKNNNKTRKHGLPTKNFMVREPLEKLIKLLRTKYSCKKNSNCSRSERILKESKSQGILLKDFVIVSHYDGSDNYSSIGEAIAAAPNNTRPEDGYFVVYVREGYYEEYVVVPKEKKNILLIGDGINNTIITGNHSFIDGWSTFNSSTFAVSGERFIAVDITFRNTAGPEKHQAVAVRNNADLSTFYRCSFEGYQDTLYVHSLRQFYRECHIYGTVDFIFGNAAVVFQSCNIYARNPMANQKNAVTAQGRNDPNMNTGISIHNCSISAAPDLNTSSTMTYLGRPWKEYSRTVYLQSYIGDLIEPSGWLEWNGTIGLDTLFYGEFNNYGPGSNTSNRVHWPGYVLLNATQASNFTVLNFTLGNTWLPDTDIPYTEGLLN